MTSPTIQFKLSPDTGLLFQIELKKRRLRQRDVALLAEVDDSAVSQVLAGVKSSPRVFAALLKLLPDFAPAHIPDGQQVYQSANPSQGEGDAQ